jgi:hypothetical protein
MGQEYPRLVHKRRGLSGGREKAGDAFVFGSLNLHKGCTG